MSLRNSIREALDAEPGPVVIADVAAKVARSVPAKERLDALTEALGHMVRDVITQQRPSTPLRPVGASATPSRSWKRESIREAERARLSELDARYATADGYKALRDFCYDELVVLADSLQDLAERNAAKAARIRCLADAVQSAGVATVADLPADALTAAGVAA